MNVLVAFINTESTKRNAEFKARTLMNRKKMFNSHRVDMRKSSSCENTIGYSHTRLDSDIKLNDDEYSIDYEKFKQKYPWQGLQVPENVDKSLEKVRDILFLIRNFIILQYSLFNRYMWPIQRSTYLKWKFEKDFKQRYPESWCKILVHINDQKNYFHFRF